MSEMPSHSSSVRTSLAHAGEVAQWSVMLLGWLWLGEQGMRLGWSLASGVLAVALWWAVRIVARGSAWALRSSSAVMGWLGLLGVGGVWLPDFLAPANAAHLGLLALAVVWGLWSALIETRSPDSTFELGPVAWHPVLAVGLVILVWRMPGAERHAPWGVGILLGFCALTVYLRDLSTIVRACRGPCTRLENALAPSAMGLMMGTLWLGNAWCVGLGWRPEHMVLTHLILMAGLPTLVALLLRLMGLQHGLPRAAGEHRLYASLGLLTMGVSMLWGQSALYGLLAMLLPSLAWALHCSRPRVPGLISQAVSPWWSRSMALGLGPLLLVYVGVSSVVQGPSAVQLAMSVLGGLAALQLAALLQRKTVPKPGWSGT